MVKPDRRMPMMMITGTSGVQDLYLKAKDVTCPHGTKLGNSSSVAIPTCLAALPAAGTWISIFLVNTSIASCQPAKFVIPNGRGAVREVGVLPEAEENGAQAQGREVNCSLQRKITKHARMLIVAGGHTVPSTEHGKKEKKKEVGFSLFGFFF